MSLGLNYAMRHESNVRAIAFLEGIFKTFPHWEDFSTPEFRELFKKFRAGGEGGEGWQMLVEQNFFIEHLLSGGVGRQLSEQEMSYYREPFTQTRSRIPIWQLARSVPVAGEPQEVWDAVSEITERLKRSRLPKLLFYATPGGIITEENVDWCRQNLKNYRASQTSITPLAARVANADLSDGPRWCSCVANYSRFPYRWSAPR